MGMGKMKGVKIDFKPENYNAIIKQYEPLINKFTYQFYQQYNSVLDYQDAHQEVMLCFWKCLLEFNPEKAKFITFFYRCFFMMKSRFYYSYFHQINIAQRKEETALATDGKRVSSDEEDQINSDERFAVDEKLDIRRHLSAESLEVYEVYLRSFRVNPWLVSKQIGVSRYVGKEKYDQFRREVAIFFDLKNIIEQEAEV